MIVDSRGTPYPETGGARTSRRDTWANPVTGVGTAADKSIYGRFGVVRRITDVEITNLYNGSPLAAKIIEKRPMEMMRAGYTLGCNDPDVDESALVDLQDYAE